jgi:Zn-dependent protease with chaperone function
MIRFAARYYDGRSSRPIEVVLRVEDPEVLHVDGLGQACQLPLRDVLLAPRLGNTTRSIELPDGAKCETQDNDAVDQVARLMGRGTGSALVHRLESSWRWVLVAVVAVGLLVSCGLKWGIPALADQVARAVPQAMACDLGRGTLATLDRMTLRPSALPEARRAKLRRSFSRVGAQYPALPLKLEFRSGVGPNAFALPDGTVIATDELVELAHHDDEILAVLVHEIGHVHHRHALRAALESSSTGLLVGAYLGDATSINAVAAALPVVYARASYSQRHETEADTFALEYLRRSGIAPRRFADILQRLHEKYGSLEGDAGFAYVASHPPTAERIARFR